ncbi:hypothetical protein MTO96_027747 [Rhipicephalus appendiculatus]
MLDGLLSGKEDPKNISTLLIKATQKLFVNATFPSLGVMGFVKTVLDFAHYPELTAWYKNLAASVTNHPNVTIFLGIKLKEKGDDLATKSNLAADLFRAAKDMRVALLVLVTHNVEAMGNNSCTTTPISSWKASVYKDPTKPALVCASFIL